MILRIKFSKHGPVRYIGHLDVMRYFQKTVRRAGIDIKYSTGFSPHQIMSFAQPLSVGHESNGEYMDIEVNSMTSCADIMERLNQTGSEGIRVLSVRVLPPKAGNAMASVAAASYSVYWKAGNAPLSFDPDTIQSQVEAFLKRTEIMITKEGKSGVREVDIRPGIYELKWIEDHFFMLLDASSGGNIKPSQVLEAMYQEQDEALKENALFVIREDTYTRQTKENGGSYLISLGEIGEII